MTIVPTKPFSSVTFPCLVRSLALRCDIGNRTLPREGPWRFKVLPLVCVISRLRQGLYDGDMSCIIPSTHLGFAHIWLSQANPSQGNPPFDGAGLLQTLDLPWEASPQVALQSDQGDQGPQLPSR